MSQIVHFTYTGSYLAFPKVSHGGGHSITLNPLYIRVYSQYLEEVEFVLEGGGDEELVLTSEKGVIPTCGFQFHPLLLCNDTEDVIKQFFYTFLSHVLTSIIDYYAADLRYWITPFSQQA
ncbi:hypothetical protein NPIL_372631 [Nephila pilipes]|uniref:Uncharacterized protein n=1 Tax=Nephila pilipes TaxID=299642 RepID=A0A8X6QGY9_NEPPI|nr:hypothetical protein NPIL_372631 [Nephila pilipes]